MSVYSGFATRTLEHNYNHAVGQVLTLLSNFVSATLRNEPFETDTWTHSFNKSWTKLSRLENQKHQPPKYSGYCAEVAKLCGITADIPAPYSPLDYSVAQLSTISRDSAETMPK
mmetsp:Transcript_17183/g.30914  ORF Transcript_17183/g.30914 Transcript_17183/m.30914 type:complete len:114 (+) Transcript_17183:2739-3080(+)